MKTLLQIISVLSLSTATVLNIRKSRWCWVFYQIGCSVRMIMFLNVGLNIEMLIQVFFTIMNVKGFLKWRK